MRCNSLLGLRGKLVLAMVTIGAIPMALGLTASYFKSAANLREIIGDGFEALAMNGAATIDGEIQRLIDESRMLARQAVRDQSVTGSLQASSKDTEMDWPGSDVEQGRPGFLLRSWITGRGDTASGRGSGEHAIAADADASRVNLFPVGEQKDSYRLDITMPVRVRGETTGWLHRRYNANKLLDSLVYPIRFGDTGHVMLIDHTGTVISCPFLATGSSIADTGLPPLIAQKTEGWVRADHDGHGGEKDSLIGHAPLTGLNAYLHDKGIALFTFAWQDSEEIFAPVRGLQQGVIFTGLTSLALLALLGFYASSRVVKPIRRLSEEAGFIAKGDLSRSIDICSGDEIEELANQFNHMTSQLRQLVDNMEETCEERTRDLIATQAEKDQVVKQLIQTEKIAAVGVMTSGIGHEINNPLYAILGRAEAIKDGIPPEKASEYGQAIIDYCKHISSIIKDLAGFVRPHDEDALESVDVNKKIAKAVTMVKMPLLNDHVKIVDKCQDVPGIQAQPQEIQQIFFNIIRNGVQAIDDRGTVEIESSLEDGYVRVSIKDNGSGISGENLEKIFDPFFTTKGPEQGEGLGLHIVRKSVQKNGGTITVESRLGEGTAFYLKFPAE